MKNKILLLSTLFMISTQAQAGFVVGVTGLVMQNEDVTNVGRVTAGIGGGLAFIAFFGVLASEWRSTSYHIFSVIGGVGLSAMVLDEDEIPSNEVLIKVFETRYPEFEDRSLLASLADQTRLQMGVTVPDVNGLRLIRIPAEIMSRILEPSGIQDSNDPALKTLTEKILIDFS